MVVTPQMLLTNGVSSLGAIELARLFSGIARIRAVKRVILDHDSSPGMALLDAWITLESDTSTDDEMRIYGLEYDFRRVVGAFPVELHVYREGEIPEEAIPTGLLMFGV